MHTKNNRTNHDFQIAYFMVGECHTADGAYALLCALREDRENALKMVKSVELRNQAKCLRAKAVLEASQDEASRLEARADIEEIQALQETTQRNIAGAEAELATILKCIEIVQPMRVYAHLSDPEAHEAAQREEWKGSLIRRAENFIMTQGTIPADHFNAMRLHPDFQDEILPALTNVKALLLANNVEGLRALQNQPRSFDLPKVLAAFPAPMKSLPKPAADPN